METGSDIIDWLKKHRAELQSRYSVEQIGLFGSWARGEMTPSSDIDILVQLQKRSFDHYMDLKLLLEDTFGRKVDLVMMSALKPRLKEYILSEVKYAA